MAAIPFNRPSFAGNEQKYIAETIANHHLSGDGPFTKACNRFLEESLGVPRALLTTNCTHALEMTALLLNIRPGDEVILPSFTFVSTANAFVLQGAKPVFVDIRPDTLNIDETRLEAAVTPKTRGIVVVHYAGVGAEMNPILEIGKRRGIAVIEDNAHGLFARYRGKPLGTFGALATQSFHETKNFTCGEGGALLINDERFTEAAEIIREKGTDRSRFFRGQVDKYTWVAPGSSYLPSDILAAFLFAQFEAKERIQTARERIWNMYAQSLASWAEKAGVTLPYVPPHCDQAYHMFYLLMRSLDERRRLIAHLRSQEINAVFHYVPLHRSAMAERLGAAGADCPVTDSVSDRLVRLPFFTDISEDEQLRVTQAIRAFEANRVA